MKVKLLKKLRKKYLRKYEIFQGLRNYTVKWIDCKFFNNVEYYTTSEKAKKAVMEKVREDILKHVYELKGPIKFNPWK